ncbi:hypothetical protein CISIN_1g033820mg [Citrus sinensis]|uniref:Uncharacterized protein n=1 Tax=Citrus sinensis TaxID=2711 RepID=A0A067EFL6_CITSI|nr:hypothetical protein CISIN_1g033820mg [Citrus sinensis]
MRAPSLGRAVPVKTPQAAVCGEFPISHRPTIGSATEIKSRICGSSVNSFPHIDFRTVVKTKAESPKPNAMVMHGQPVLLNCSLMQMGTHTTMLLFE